MRFTKQQEKYLSVYLLDRQHEIEALHFMHVGYEDFFIVEQHRRRCASVSYLREGRSPFPLSPLFKHACHILPRVTAWLARKKRGLGAHAL